MKFHPGFMAGHGKASLYNLIRLAGASSGLALCLDFGFSACYPGTGQTVTDLSGNTNYWMGADGTVSILDPVFNGTPNAASPDEYMSMGFMTAKADNAWHTSAHKDGAAFTVMVIGENSGSDFAYLTTDGATFRPGITILGTTSKLLFRVRNGVGTSFDRTSTVTGNALTTNVMFVSVSENGGAAASHFRINGNAETFNAAYTSPSSSAQGDSTTINTFAGNGYNLSGFCAWSRALTTTETSDVFEEIRDRWAI